MTKKKARIGVWLIGARGGVATTALVGLCALRLRSDAGAGVGVPGLVTTLPWLANLPMPDWDEIVAGGHEIRDVSLLHEARLLATESRTVSADLVEQCRPLLEEIDRRIRPGTVLNAGA